MDEMLFAIDEDGKLVKYAPYAEIAINSEEEYEEFQRRMVIAASVIELMEKGYTLEKEGSKSITNIEELLAVSEVSED